MYKFYTFIVISCISSFLVYNFSNKQEVVKEKIKEEIKQEESLSNDIKEDVSDIKKISFEIEEEKELFTLEIPKIKLKQNVYNKNSILNDIEKNVIIMKESNLPDEENGIVIIGAHSGYGKYAYFKNLNKIDINDEIIIHYNNKDYIYKVIEYHLDSKDGSISINNFNKKNKLFLYTCNPNDKNNYLVYDCERE